MEGDVVYEITGDEDKASDDTADDDMDDGTTLTCKSPPTFTNSGTALMSTSPQPVPTQQQLPANQFSKVSIQGAPLPLIYLKTAMVNPAISPSSI